MIIRLSCAPILTFMCTYMCTYFRFARCKRLETVWFTNPPKLFDTSKFRTQKSPWTQGSRALSIIFSVEPAALWHPQNALALAGLSEGWPSMIPMMIPISVDQKGHLPKCNHLNWFLCSSCCVNSSQKPIRKTALGTAGLNQIAKKKRDYLPMVTTAMHSRLR